MSKIICTTISDEFFNLAKENKIKWSEAMRVGIAISLGEKGVRQYNNNLNTQRIIMNARIRAEQELAKLQEVEKNLKKENTEEDAKQEL